MSGLRISGALLAGAVLASAACVPEEGPMMDPGRDCLECHSGGEGPTWTVAGTVFRFPDSPEGDGVEGVDVRITDANGRRITIRSNQAGNFYTAEKLRFPVRVSIAKGGEEHEMDDPIDYGGCNSCHDVPPREEAEGRVSLESRDLTE